MVFYLQQNEQELLLIYRYILPIGTILILLFLAYRLSLILQFYYASRFRKPIINHLYIKLYKLSPDQLLILKQEFSFYGKLNPKEQSYFEHRVAKFIKKVEFIGKEELVVTDHMRLVLAATATMLTFGYRNYRIKLLDKILLYPQEFYSTLDEEKHKGEFNPAYKAIVLSWEDVLMGFSIDNDNINLAIHEFVHALHLDSLHSKGARAAIFLNSFSDLAVLLEQNVNYRQNLIASDYFRKYAYTNQYEFVAVIIETFIETPHEFKVQFPQIYDKTKQMLNFNFANY